MPVTHDQAQQLASLACAIRPYGARRWDAPGVMAALGHVKELDLAEVAMVVIAGAADRTLDTPAAIGNTKSPLWLGRWRNADKVEVRPTSPGMVSATPLTYAGAAGDAVSIRWFACSSICAWIG